MASALKQSGNLLVIANAVKQSRAFHSRDDWIAASAVHPRDDRQIGAKTQRSVALKWIFGVDGPDYLYHCLDIPVYRQRLASCLRLAASGSSVPKMKRHPVLTTMGCIGLAIWPAISGAEAPKLFSIAEPKPVSEFWLNPGFYSYHFQKNRQLNDSNFGPGGEYRFSTVSSIAAGIFKNSDRHTSRYVGWVWQPLELGKVRLGAVAGAIDGYPKMRNGGWFLAVVPVVGFEYKRVGANLVVVPTYKDRVYSSISLQLKLRIF